MKRDVDLLRKILTELENSNNTSGYPVTLNIPEYSQEIISLHVALLNDAGLVEARCTQMHDFILWEPSRITNAGYEFLEASRDNDRWEKAKTIMLKETGGIVIDLLSKVLANLMAKALHLQ